MSCYMSLAASGSERARPGQPTSAFADRNNKAADQVVTCMLDLQVSTVDTQVYRGLFPHVFPGDRYRLVAQ